MDKLPDHKERSLAWLKRMTDAQTLWREMAQAEQAEPKQRMTAASVNEKYYRELIDQALLHYVIDDINCLVRDMYTTPDQICHDDAEALAALIAIRTNCEVVLNHQRTNR